MLWPTDAGWPLRVVREPLAGLSHARRRGLEAAKYEFVSFVDDDNWVCSNWVSLVHEIFVSRPDVAACGGAAEAVFESPPPAWFSTYHGSFAIGQQHSQAGDV